MELVKKNLHQQKMEFLKMDSEAENLLKQLKKTLLKRKDIKNLYRRNIPDFEQLLREYQIYEEKQQQQQSFKLNHSEIMNSSKLVLNNSECVKCAIIENKCPPGPPGKPGITLKIFYKIYLKLLIRIKGFFAYFGIQI